MTMYLCGTTCNVKRCIPGSRRVILMCGRVAGIPLFLSHA